MDVNNTPFFLLRSREELAHDGSGLSWNTALEALTLAPNQALRLPASDPPNALAAWAAATPLALDRFGQVGRLDAARTVCEFNSGRGFLPLRDERLSTVGAPLGTFRDLTLGGDGRLVLPYSDGAGRHGLSLFHLARRWQTHCALNVPSPPRRAWVDAANRIWCVGADWLLLLAGEPLPSGYRPRPDRFEPERANPRELAPAWPAPQALPAGWEALALCDDGEQISMLCQDGAGHQALFTRALTSSREIPLRRYDLSDEVPFAVDLAALAPDRFAALPPRDPGDSGFLRRDCPLLALHRAGGTAELVRERYPMLSLASPRFVASADRRVRYQSVDDADYPGLGPRPRLLQSPHRPEYELEGTAILTHVLDSGRPDTIWHRVYLDACIPSGCALGVDAAAFALPDEADSAPAIPQPTPVWNPLPSELPFGQSLAAYRAATGGLFEVLLQRPDGPVRRLAGRYLRLTLHLRGDGRQTPAVYALRIYAPRFSYQEAYLPELFRQELDADAARGGPANGADVRERMLAAFEGMWTPLEGRIAAGEQLINPDAAPSGQLTWLAEALGTALPSHWPDARQRRLIREATLVQPWKGTLCGVDLALDIATDGGIVRGEVAVLENFRLRRTMATILGIDMDDRQHPLTLGTGMSGNSIVGDSLILSEADARSFLALFAADPAHRSEAEQVEAFFERYAHQVSVLLHGAGAKARMTVESVLAAQMPAHLQWRIIETEHPFVLGISPLLALDTFLEATPAFQRVTLDDTRLSREGVLQNPAAFSPRDINVRAN